MAERPPSFDPFAAEVLADPGEAYSRLNATCPFAEHRGADQTFWIVSGHEQIKSEILQDSPVWTFRFGNAQKDGISDIGFKTDPPFHNHFRAALARGFAPKPLARYAADIERIVAERIDAMLATPEGRGDFHDLFAFPLPARMMCVMLGAPESEYENYKLWADTLQHMIFSDPTPGSFETVLQEIYPHFTEQLNTRVGMLAAAGVSEARPEHVGTVLPDDFMSRALAARVEGRPLTLEEQLNVCLAFLTGGQETTISLLTNLIWRLLQDRSRWERLTADPSLIEVAVEESLRFDPPVLAHFRTSLQPTELHGCPVPERAKLMFAIAAANRDPAVFEEPDQFSLDRPVLEARKHLSFGSGVHFCIGAPVARMEGRIALTRLLDRLPDLRLIDDGERIDGWMHWGRRKLPVAWD